LIYDADNIATAPLPLYSNNKTVLCYKKGILGNYGPLYERITGQKPVKPTDKGGYNFVCGYQVFNSADIIAFIERVTERL